jgi:ABC-type protease/lipase transport system fused ATPase/permease subunit
VLDEPNSNLDSEGDEALTKAILGVRSRGGIVVVVAHRPAALAGVDSLLAIAGGRVQAYGPKEEVLRAVPGTPLHPVPAATAPANPADLKIVRGTHGGHP